MLTRRGWMIAVGSLVLSGIGRVLGLDELFGMAAAALALCVAAVLYVRFTRFQLEATRELRPPRVHAGTASRVELSVRNLAFRRSPVLTARDPFDGGRRWARLLLAPLAPGETARAAYRLPTERRGIFDLGPLELQLNDPFGLAQTSLEAAPVTKLTVYPHADDIEPVPLSQGNDPHAGADHATALSHAGEDFYALRDYQEGDDLRRVHWGATAKLDELMIRQEEMPWQGRATVLLDLREGVHTPESLEIAVSAAASVARSCWKRRSLVRLLTTGGFDSGFAAGHAHREAVLEHLAGVGVERGAHLAPLLQRLRRDGSGGALVVITTAAAGTPDLEGVARLRGRFGLVTLVLVERSAYDHSLAGRQAPSRALPPLGMVARVTATEAFPTAWAGALARTKVAAR
ncbi:MAG TPA: DUF58 domain-containing protein [Acidimicrobiales bacterium]|nr:DUF58 domain-containing protein [Acidimicrobiales bacterium]